MAPPARVAPPLTLHLHGSARAVAADGRQLALRGRAAALVALVAQTAAEGGVGRERAAQWLWPDSTNPRQTLRQQLLRFRQALGQPLLEGEAALMLAAGVHLAPPAPGALLLADEDDADERFGAWLAQQRQAQRQQQLGPLRAALQQAESSGDLAAALAHAQALLQHDPSEESHHAALMRVHYLRGEPAAGLAVYERLAAQLQADLGASPAAATRDLAQALRRSGALLSPLSAAPAARAALPVALKRPPLMAGRSAELAAVHQAWADGRAVLVEGEAGMGKSRLLAECLVDFQAAGPAGRAPEDPAPALQAAARPGDSGAPYSALARLLRPLLAQGPRALSAPAQDALQRIGATAGKGPQGTLSPGALQAAVAELLDHAGVHTVALDDLHFSDDATLELISGLATPESPRRWLLAQRPAEQTAAAMALRQGLTELQRLSVVSLRPLDADAAAALVDSLAVSGLQGQAVAQALVRHSGGNPLFLLETLKQGLLDGSLARGELPRPASVGALIEQRLQRLSEPALTLARVAAIAGIDFSIELAEAAIGQSAVQLATAWRELQDAQVLRDEALAHDLVADALQAGLPEVVARRVHSAIAAWMRRQAAAPARIAAHLWRAGQTAEAALHCLHAARLAVSQGRAADALSLLNQALQAPQWTDAADLFSAARMRCEVMWDMDLGPRLDAALQDMVSAVKTPQQHAVAQFVVLNSLYYRGDFRSALDAADAAAEAAQRAGATVELLQVRMTQARVQARLGEVAQGLALLRSTQALLAGLDDTLRFEFHGILGVLLLQAGRALEARVELQEARQLASGVGRSMDLPNLIGNIAACDHLLGHAGRAAAGQNEVIQLAAQQGQQGLALQFASMNLASALLDLNRYAEAWTWIERCGLELAAQAPAYAAMAGTLQARWYLELGQHGRAGAAFAAFPLPDDALPFVRAYRGLVHAQVAAAAHDIGTAQHLLQDAIHAARASGRPNVLWEIQLTAHALGCKEGAGELRDIALEARALGLDTHAAVAQALAGPTSAAALLLAPDAERSPRWFYRGYLHARLGASDAARRWLHDTAQRLVPPEFRESFLHRQPVNVALQSTRQGGAQEEPRRA